MLIHFEYHPSSVKLRIQAKPNNFISVCQNFPAGCFAPGKHPCTHCLCEQALGETERIYIEKNNGTKTHWYRAKSLPKPHRRNNNRQSSGRFFIENSLAFFN